MILVVLTAPVLKQTMQCFDCFWAFILVQSYLKKYLAYSKNFCMNVYSIVWSLYLLNFMYFGLTEKVLLFSSSFCFCNFNNFHTFILFDSFISRLKQNFEFCGILIFWFEKKLDFYLRILTVKRREPSYRDTWYFYYLKGRNFRGKKISRISRFLLF